MIPINSLYQGQVTVSTIPAQPSVQGRPLYKMATCPPQPAGVYCRYRGYIKKRLCIPNVTSVTSESSGSAVNKIINSSTESNENPSSQIVSSSIVSSQYSPITISSWGGDWESETHDIPITQCWTSDSGWSEVLMMQSASTARLLHSDNLIMLYYMLYYILSYILSFML